ncbi:LytR/AlgR family response regulator transcription factor [Aquiflexum gelatinilyticum]|jgi:two-component system LytT family response regulator|uniref:LytTR family DNA-binding domain-containing protein n=1 Tax=Aquiflexum gelatinilyticum TaxID=2961943 RepID=A0A9X2P3H4_9BACT|nr:LytTR family DNA-binding domain-containing protein [Aquiflexum gelatinilyticum]MCR9015519.1 LytTR family DNA-binding domain-containing protein [Aquiflexum gelatinilyticum]MCS4433063.1 LytTR family DNA-binding domain-containing protein [Aquiflexum gelatinilyticum]
MNKKCFLVDDEILAIKELETMLKVFPELEIVGSSDRAAKAVEMINSLKPDLIFLDINMPGMNGFELLENLEETPNVIFVTAYDEYAIQAFEVNALDYILKPVNPERLRDAINKIQKRTQSEKANESEKLGIDKKIFIKDGEKCYFVPIRDIYLIESEGNYVKVYFENKKALLHKSLTYMENRLTEEVFFRANRQFILNLNFIKNIEPYFNSTLLVEMKTGQKIDLSQRQSVKFREITGV